jgi:hypothetical protein
MEGRRIIQTVGTEGAKLHFGSAEMEYQTLKIGGFASDF